MAIGALIAKTIGGAILGGAAQGLSKRIEAQVGGKKAAVYGASGQGATNAAQAQMQRDYVHALGTQQSTSQGQTISHQEKLNQDRYLHEGQMANKQHAHEKQMMLMQMSHDAQIAAGQAPWYSKGGNRLVDFIGNSPYAGWMPVPFLPRDMNK